LKEGENKKLEFIFMDSGFFFQNDINGTRL